MDPFWTTLRPSNVQKELPPPATISACIDIPKKPSTTKEQRCSSILSKCQVLAQLASQTVYETEQVVEIIDGLIKKLLIEHSSGKESKSVINGREDQVSHQATTTQHIANPPIQQNQTQARKQPSAIGAPTTSSHKAAGYQSKRKKKATEKARDLKALGL